MTIDEAKEAYTARFGGFPYFSNGTDDELIAKVQEALETGEPISAEWDNVDVNWDEFVNWDDEDDDEGEPVAEDDGGNAPAGETDGTD